MAYSLYRDYLGLTKVVLKLARIVSKPGVMLSSILRESAERTETTTKPTSPAPSRNVNFGKIIIIMILTMMEIYPTLVSLSHSSAKNSIPIVHVNHCLLP